MSVGGVKTFLKCLILKESNMKEKKIEKIVYWKNGGCFSIQVYYNVGIGKVYIGGKKEIEKLEKESGIKAEVIC